jgi:serine protease
VYVSAQDANCTPTNANVVFDVNPINAGGQFLARAFFPANSRAGRNVAIDGSSFGAGQNLVGILRHELGHTLGFRHEHTRPESGTCFEDNSWRSLTVYDSSSVMHYPQCNGTGSFDSLALTALDKQGAVAIYGAPGINPNPNPNPTPVPAGTVTENFTAAIAQGATKAFPAFAAKAGTTFKVTMTGTGDGDLYVRFGALATASIYNCRPFLDGSAEECVLTVPATATQVFVSVNGFTASNVSLAVNYVKDAAVTPPPSTGTAKTATFSGSLAKGQQNVSAPLTVVPGSTFKVVMSGTGDADLYVKFGAAASLTVFDCRPFLNGSAETCNVTVPAGATSANIMVNGFAISTYSLAVNYTAP